MTSSLPDVLPMPAGGPVIVQHVVSGFSVEWTIEDVDVPEAPLHDQVVRLLQAILEYAASNVGRPVGVYRDLAVRVSEPVPNVGFNPDVCWVEEPPEDRFNSLCLWKPGHRVPRLCIEVVSENHPYKDYRRSPDICAAAGVEELIVVNPLAEDGIGPREPIHVWQRREGVFERVHAGTGGVRSHVVGGYIVTTPDGRFRFAEDADGAHLWPTAEEAAKQAAKHAEQAAKHAEQAAKHAEQVAKQAEQAALRRVAELEMMLRERDRR